MYVHSNPQNADSEALATPTPRGTPTPIAANNPRLCRHIKTSGLQCRGNGLRGSHFCYFHRRLHESHDLYKRWTHFHPTSRDQGAIIDLPLLEDRESVQLAISKVVHALSCNLIDHKHAALLLYGLQIAARNVRGLGDIVSAPADVVQDVTTIPEHGSSSPDIAPAGRDLDPAANPAQDHDAAPCPPVPELRAADRPASLPHAPLPPNVIAISAAADPAIPAAAGSTLHPPVYPVPSPSEPNLPSTVVLSGTKPLPTPAPRVPASTSGPAAATPVPNLPPGPLFHHNPLTLPPNGLILRQ